MAICFHGIHTPPNDWSITLRKSLRLRHGVPAFSNVGNPFRLDNDSRCFWGLAGCSENRCQVWDINALYIPHLQWLEAIDLGYGPSIGQETEWKSVMVCFMFFYDFICRTGFVQAYRWGGCSISRISGWCLASWNHRMNFHLIVKVF